MRDPYCVKQTAVTKCRNVLSAIDTMTLILRKEMIYQNFNFFLNFFHFGIEGCKESQVIVQNVSAKYTFIF